MNNKKIIISLLVIVGILFIIFFWFFLRPKNIPNDNQININTGDPLFPHSTSSNSQNTGNTTTDTDINNNTDIYPDTSTTSIDFPDTCNQETTTIDRNGCISEMAKDTKKSDICDFIVGSLAKASCMNNVTQKTMVFPKTPTSYQDFIESFPKNTINETSESRIVSNSSALQENPVKETDSRYTAEGFVQRYSSEGKLSIYALSQYEAKPGETVYIYGSGFVYPNIIMVGSVPVSDVKSLDGFSLSFIAPSSGGKYEIGVTNSKGGIDGPKPVLFVTDNPKSRPAITGYSPSLIGLSDNVTLMGIGLTQDNTISTTLGVIEHVSSEGGSITFNISKLPILDQIKDLKEIKGKKIPIGVYISNKNGFNKDLFYFDVQF